MSRGGARPGAGRKKGSVSQIRKIAAETAIEMAADGVSPLEFLLSVMRNPAEDKGRRLDAAKAAANYCHPKLANIEHSGDPERPVAYSVVSGVERTGGAEVVNGSGFDRADH